MGKIDMKKTLKECYTAKSSVELVQIPKIKYITYLGKGNPGTSEEFKTSMEVLYGIAYTVKFQYKKKEQDFIVMPLEGQWWTDIPEDFSMNNKDKWNWKVMIALPDYITEEDFEASREVVRTKKNPIGLDKAKLEEIEDGLSVQLLYIGPYDDEAPYIAEMHKYAENNGYKLRDKHREIYLNNPKRVTPEKLKTIIRQPIEKM